MIDFLRIATRTGKHGVIEVYPNFIITKSKDLMIRGSDFYAIWLEERDLWSTEEQDALQLIDRELDIYANEHKQFLGDNVRVLHMWDAQSGMIDIWHKYCQRQMRDNYHTLDETLIFANTSVKKDSYASKRLPYPLEQGSIAAYDELMTTLYTPEEREKIEWAIGSIVNGDSKKIQKFLVLYSRFSKFPKIDRYLNTQRLVRLRERVLVDMDFERPTVSHHENVFVEYDKPKYLEICKTRWNLWENKPIETASEFCYLLRKLVNTDLTRSQKVLDICMTRPRVIIFYNFDYELDILMNLPYGDDAEVAQWNGHKHQPIPDGKKWVYLVQYNAGAEGWNCVKTDTIIFYSQNYSYKIMEQAAGRIDRLNTPYKNLFYYHLKSRAGIDLAIGRALMEKKKFNERKFYGI